MADFNYDGKPDIVTGVTSRGQIGIRDAGADHTYAAERVIVVLGSPLVTVITADANSDGRRDLFSLTSTGRTAMHLNDGTGRFSTSFINTNSFGATSLHAADVDRDGDVDLVMGGTNDTFVAWLENLGAPGATRWILRSVSRTGSKISAVQFASIFPRATGNLDIVTISAVEGTLVLYQNSGLQQFVKVEISSLVPGATALAVFDVDGDGDNDIVVGGAGLWWFENINTNFFPSHGISNTGAVGDLGSILSLAVADVDLDGNSDLVIASSDSNVYLAKNTDGKGVFAAVEAIKRGYFAGIVAAIDADLDSDIDIFITPSSSATSASSSSAADVLENNCCFPVSAPCTIDWFITIDTENGSPASQLASVYGPWVNSTAGDGRFNLRNYLHNNLITSDVMKVNFSTAAFPTGKEKKKPSIGVLCVRVCACVCVCVFVFVFVFA